MSLSRASLGYFHSGLSTQDGLYLLRDDVNNKLFSQSEIEPPPLLTMLCAHWYLWLILTLKFNNLGCCTHFRRFAMRWCNELPRQKSTEVSLINIRHQITTCNNVAPHAKHGLVKIHVLCLNTCLCHPNWQNLKIAPFDLHNIGA